MSDALQKVRDMETVRQAAAQFTAIPEQFLGQALGREPLLEELKEFVGKASSEFLGQMYGILLKCAGKDAADKWIRQTLGLASVWVRVSGFDILLKFEVTTKEVPNTLHKKDPEKDANRIVKELQKDLGLTPPCTCVLDKDGRCTPCAEKLSKKLETGFEPFFRMKEMAEAEKKEKSCKVCLENQFDLAMSLLVPKLLTIQDGAGGQLGQEMMAMLSAMAQQAGGKPIPLTEKAWETEMTKVKQNAAS